MKPFEISRVDGRSNAQVLLDFVQGGEPGRVYGYEELVEALQVGADRSFSIRDVQSVVRQAFARLLKEQQRMLKNVRHVGYRLAMAADHNQLALDRKRKSDTQIFRGLQLLQHVREMEMDENQRNAHRGTLMLVSGLWANQKALEKRQRAAEDAIERLNRRVDSLDSKG